jgi:hypothetical protein
LSGKILVNNFYLVVGEIHSAFRANLRIKQINTGKTEAMEAGRDAGMFMFIFVVFLEADAAAHGIHLLLLIVSRSKNKYLL